MKKHVYIAVLLIVVMIFMAGCSNDESQSASTQMAAASPSPSASESESQQKTLKPKQLISKEEAAQLVGEAVKDALDIEQPVLGMTICVYAAENIESKAYLQIALIQKAGMGESSGGEGQSSEGSQPNQSPKQSESGGSGQQGGGGEEGEKLSPKSLFEALRKMIADPNAPDIGRIGEDTFVSTKGISILSAEHYIFVSGSTTDPAATDQMLKQAAQLAADNLKRIQGE